VVPPVDPAPQGSVKSGILLPTEKTAGLKAHWQQRREYLRDRDERRADDEEGKIKQLKDELALDNVFSVGAALVRESQQALAAGLPGLAKKRCQFAADMAPTLPAAHTCLARATVAEKPLAVGQAASHLLDAAKVAWEDPRTRRAFIANVGGVAAVGLLCAGALLIVLFFARYARLYVHDLHHLFPKGARAWQTAALAIAIVLLPFLLHLGPVPLVFTAALAAALYLTGTELAAAVAVLMLFAAAPYGAASLAKLAAFGGPASDAWLVEKGEGSPAAIERLERRLQNPKPEAAIAFVLGHRAKREGDLEQAEKLYRRALELGGGSPILAATHNNLGNVFLLTGDPEKARKNYAHAVELQETLAAPHFNLARAHGLAGVESLDRVQAEQARALELDRAGVDAFTGGALQLNKRSNKIAMDLPLPEAAFEQLLDLEGQTASPVVDDVRAMIAGPLPQKFGEATPIAVAVGCIALFAMRGRTRPSGQCERCGREVCKRCDLDARPTEALCAQCVNVFVRKGNVDATERIKKEMAVQRYQARKKLWARLLAVVSGASHVLLGYPLQGALFLLLTGLLGASLWLWRGIAHEPFAVRTGLSLARIGITVVAFFVVYALCMRDLSARQRAEGL
jgi:Flp pilus assembly protein TadD